jgi:hypothetical protein
MSSQTRTVVIGAAAVAVAVALFIVLQGSDEDDDGATSPKTTAVEQQASGDASQGGGNQQEPQEPEVATIVVRDGQPVGGAQELEFAKGERIRFTVESDIADEVHLHGYDVTENVDAGGKVTFDVSATIEGVFEAESHHSGAQIAEITVTP